MGVNRFLACRPDANANFANSYLLFKAVLRRKVLLEWNMFAKSEFILARFWPGSAEARRDRPGGRGPWTRRRG